jgi:hypothetical protein
MLARPHPSGTRTAFTGGSSSATHGAPGRITVCGVRASVPQPGASEPYKPHASQLPDAGLRTRQSPSRSCAFARNTDLSGSGPSPAHARSDIHTTSACGRAWQTRPGMPSSRCSPSTGCRRRMPGRRHRTTRGNACRCPGPRETWTAVTAIIRETVGIPADACPDCTAAGRPSGQRGGSPNPGPVSWVRVLPTDVPAGS